MNYIGSKNKLSVWIQSIIKSEVDQPMEDLIFCDLFAGTGIIGRNFKSKVSRVIANDVEYYSFVLLNNYIANHQDLPNKDVYIEKLNKLSKVEGFIAKEYGEGGEAQRLFFSKHNAQKIDAIRQQIDYWKKSDEINDELFYFLLTSLLESADKIANTASVYGAFLKKIKASAAREIQIKPAKFIKTPNSHQVYQEDANTLIKKIEGDILYLDPPYNARQYGANYHLLNTIALYEEFTPRGKTGLPDYYKSLYCRKNHVAIEFEELIKNANFSYIFLSYNNEGLMPPDLIKSIMEKHGNYHLETQTYQRFKADKTENRNHKASQTTEYLHCLKK